VDRNGIPLSAWHGPANEHDAQRFEAMLELVAPIKGPRGRPRTRPEKLHADQAYDIPRGYASLTQRGILDRLARKGSESRERLGRFRWVAERTIAWIFQFRRLQIRWERRDALYQAFLDLACAIICFRTLKPGYC
jgi:hypothetical protein